MPDGFTKQDEDINRDGLEEDSLWIEDSYLAEPVEWEDLVLENDRFIQELDSMGEREEVDKYQLT